MWMVAKRHYRLWCPSHSFRAGWRLCDVDWRALSDRNVLPNAHPWAIEAHVTAEENPSKVE